VEAYAILFFILAFRLPIFWIVFILYMLILRRQIRFFHVMIGVLIVLTFLFIITHRPIINRVDHTFLVVEVHQKTNYRTLVIKNKGIKYQMNTNNRTLIPGDIIHVTGTIEPYRSRSIPYGFDPKAYYLSKGIYAKVLVEKWSLIKQDFYLYQVRWKLLQRIEDLSSKPMIEALIFGIRMDEKKGELYQKLDILYLFSVSGMHLYVGLNLIDLGCFHLGFNKTTKRVIQSFFLLFFLMMYHFSFAVLRVILMKILSFFNRKYHLNLTQIDSIQIVFMMLLLMNGYLIHSTGFLMLYIIINALHLLKPLYIKQQGYIRKLIMTCIIQSFIYPFKLRISLLMILAIPIITFIITGPLFILSLITLIFPKLDDFFSHIISLFNLVIQLLNHSYLGISMPAIPEIGLPLFYLGLIFLYGSKTIKQIIFRFLFLLFLIVLPKIRFYPITDVYFVDVGQGDSAIIMNASCVIVVDSYQFISELLLNKGVDRIDYLILTHNHQDHTNEAKDLLRQFDVTFLVLSAFDEYQLTHSTILFVKSDDQIRCGDIEINILGPIHPSSIENNRSIVFQTQIHDVKYLFTGDIEKDAESDLVNKYRYHLKSDVLKVAHHGSKTSSSVLFLSYVNPSVVIISSRINNKHGFPHQEVIKRLEEMQVTIYQTSIHGTIQSRHYKKKQKWTLLLPI